MIVIRATQMLIIVLDTLLNGKTDTLNSQVEN